MLFYFIARVEQVQTVDFRTSVCAIYSRITPKLPGLYQSE